MTVITDSAAGAESAWGTCGRCKNLIYSRRFQRDLQVCADCGHHERLTADERLDMLLDPGSRVPLGVSPPPADPLEFADAKPYLTRLAEARERTGLDEAVVCARGTIEGRELVVAAMDFRFMGGSLGSAVGDLIVQAAEAALADRVPLLLVTASGGARMQEGVLALMQMAKTSQALAALDEAGVLTLTLVTDPTFGGVAASFATLTDIVIAEPGARMGFAGARVIEQTIRQRLPKGFQTAEFLLRHGLIDMVRPRAALRSTIGRLLAAQGEGPPPAPREEVVITDPALLPAGGDAWATVQIARNIDRPTALDYISHMTDWFEELHGDRAFGDCRAVIGGLAHLDGAPVVVIGHQKGHTTRELAERNFAMPSPEGYRKCARIMRLAAKLGLPVITLIDTPGAYPGLEAEERGQAIAIAENLRLMSGLPVPVVAVVTGEGGSGGALALGVANRVLSFENSVYSVISPEGCAAILWNDAAAASVAAEALRPCARDLLRLAIVDGVIPEPEGGTQADHVRAAELLQAALSGALRDLAETPPAELVRDRRRRFHRFGGAA